MSKGIAQLQANKDEETQRYHLANSLPCEMASCDGVGAANMPSFPLCACY